MPIKQIALPNGMIVNRNVANTVHGKLLDLQIMQQGYKLWEFVHLCKNPTYVVAKETQKLLIRRHLLHSDGQPKADVQNIVLYMTKGNGDKIEVITLKEFYEMVGEADQGSDVE